MTLGFANDKGFLLLPAKQIFAVASDFEFSAVFEKVAIVFEHGDKPKTFFSTGFDHHRTEIVTVKQHPGAYTFGWFEFANKFGSQLCSLLKLSLKKKTIFFCDIDSKPEGNRVTSKRDGSCYILMTSYIAACQ